ncbi:MAG: hypothetical protein L0G39_14095 [Chryseobacterium sp.]|uniref:hypothetical protein n=1 Tax=Chryseobacterium carnipullorum TaxID=1124835 RepID=UPI00091F0A12|nr:hypothetical protein [Chryseobacterium carnipullorum]MDN5395372.1 hypothetical protein [Chryseobacterium sp.]MDN5422140.1 hypothetical protein [Chryseobacterium sp.]MDN5478065.1 hypothetical protein [Chryseobacterium sp.]MDN5480439.1 hypothetical protein [Chryseobacterium sp.]SHL80161.1 hypothetical protein SAMN05444360_104233 [Chryseobacterium carnipullorum]
MMQTTKENRGEHRKYTFLREERYQFQGLRNENFIEAELKVTLTSLDYEKPVFTVEMPFYKQSNKEGMYKWIGDLHQLREKIVCTLDENGQLGTIINLDDIRNQWKELKPKIILRHRNEHYREIFIKGVEELLEDGERLAQALRFAMPYQLLFPGIHFREFKKNEITKGYRELPNFIAAKSVPITTEERISKLEDGRYQIDVKGSIDENNFAQDKVTAMIRILKNRPRVPTLLQLNYIERYLLEEWPWSEQSMCMSLAQIPGTLYREEKNILKAIAHDHSLA